MADAQRRPYRLPLHHRAVGLWFRLLHWWQWSVWRNLQLHVVMGQAGDLWIRPEWKLEDLWIGLYWRVTRSKYHQNLGELNAVDVWLCVIPCLPLHFRWRRFEEEVPF